MENSLAMKFIRHVPRVLKAALMASAVLVVLVVKAVLVVVKAMASAPVPPANNSTTEIA